MILPVIFGFLLAAEPWPGAAINRATWDELPLGITAAQAIAILGAPGDYRLFPQRDANEATNIDIRSNDYSHHWTSDFGKINLRIDSDGIVNGKMFSAITPSPMIYGHKLIQFRLLTNSSQRRE